MKYLFLCFSLLLLGCEQRTSVAHIGTLKSATTIFAGSSTQKTTVIFEDGFQCTVDLVNIVYLGRKAIVVKSYECWSGEDHRPTGTYSYFLTQGEDMKPYEIEVNK